MIGSIIHGNLRVKSLLGGGAMGSVYLAEIPPCRYPVRGQSIAHRTDHDPSFRSRFFIEAKILSQLYHPNIVQVQDFFQHGDSYCQSFLMSRESR
jgi:serine/threonine protein kinase